MRPPLAVGVLASGEGTTTEALLAAAAAPGSPFRVAVVISDRPGVPVLARAERAGVPTAVIPSRGPGAEGWDARVSDALRARAVGLVVLAGYLSILPARWVAEWRGRAVNLHPSLLPRYGGRGMYGDRVHAAVLAAGERETGATLHLLTGDVDGGPPVAQSRLEVRPDDTPASLHARLRPVEIALVVDSVRAFAEGRLPLPYPGGDAGDAPRGPRERLPRD
jgi:phosphoribosylglycinamide formyltransferase 1